MIIYRNIRIAIFPITFQEVFQKKIFDLVSGIEPVIQIPNTIIIPRMVAAIIAAMVLYTVHPMFCFILIIWTIGYLTTSYLTSKNTANFSYSLSESDNTLGGKVVDSLTNMSSTKLFSNFKYESEIIDKAADEYVNKERTLQWHMLKIHFVQGLWVTILISLMLWGLIHERLNNSVTVGDFALILNLTVVFTMTIYNTGQQLIQLSKEIGKCRQALNIIVEPHEIQDRLNASVLKERGVKYYLIRSNSNIKELSHCLRINQF